MSNTDDLPTLGLRTKGKVAKLTGHYTGVYTLWRVNF